MKSADGKPQFRRWLNVVLRGVHLVAVIVLGAVLLGAPVAGDLATATLVVTGLAMFAVDTWSHPGHLRELAGVAMLLKLVLVVWMAADAAARPLLFWLIVVGSAFSSHAPARVRHLRLWPPGRHAPPPA